MHTCIPSHRLKRSQHSYPRQVNAGKKKIPSMHHSRRRNVTTSMVGLKNGHICKNLTKNGEPQRYSWGMQMKKRNRQRQPAYQEIGCVAVVISRQLHTITPRSCSKTQVTVPPLPLPPPTPHSKAKLGH